MRNCSRTRFCALAACVAAGVYLGAGAAAAAPLAGIGTKPARAQNYLSPVNGDDVATPVERRSYYGSEFDGGYAYDYSAWYPPPPAYYPPVYYPPPYYTEYYTEWVVPKRRYYRSHSYRWRPSSCGEYRYWKGSCCVDARRHRPYVGPKW
jgi:hypothetical protein